MVAKPIGWTKGNVARRGRYDMYATIPMRHFWNGSPSRMRMICAMPIPMMERCRARRTVEENSSANSHARYSLIDYILD